MKGSLSGYEMRQDMRLWFYCVCIFMIACVCSLQQTYEAKRQEFLVELQRREDEMRQMFVQRVKEKEAELKEAEREVCRPADTHTQCMLCVKITTAPCMRSQGV